MVSRPASPNGRGLAARDVRQVAEEETEAGAAPSTRLATSATRSCLLITNGDNNGALNYYFRSHGGEWTWVENEPDQIPQIEAFLGETVLAGSEDSIPSSDAAFDVVVSIDVHEHLEDCTPFNQELYRVTCPGGLTIVTTPNGGDWRPLTVLKNLVGMTPEKYGHQVVGYTIEQHQAMLGEVGLQPIRAGSYSRFFTELIELVINFALRHGSLEEIEEAAS